MRITRRHLQVALAVLWLLDGLLQCQPFMFGRGFAHRVLAPATVGQPSGLAALQHTVIDLVSSHPALANGLFALIQVVLGLALFTRRFTRPALAASIVWGLGVWTLGEGLGGLATGGTILSGAPGAAVLYAVVATLAWPTHEYQGNERPSWLALPIWSTLWLMAAVLQLIDGNDSSTSLTMMLRMAQSGAPGWIGQMDHQLSHVPLPSWTIASLLAIYVLVAIWILIPGWTRQFSIALGLFVSMTSWLLFQGLGDLTSGQATDPNAGPLIVLLALAVVGARSRDTDDGTQSALVANEPNPVSVLVRSS